MRQRDVVPCTDETGAVVAETRYLPYGEERWADGATVTDFIFEWPRGPCEDRLSHLIGEVHYGGQVVIVERSGRPMVSIIPVDDYQRLIAEREARFQVLDEIRRQMSDLPVEEVERDVAEAVA
jgi:prevent-host-death family protein